MNCVFRQVFLAAFVVGILGAPWASSQDLVLPPGMAEAEDALKKSPRHVEIVQIPLPGSDRTVRTLVAFPERATKAPVVLVIHEIFGMTDWSNSVADQLAEEGFIAVAPDFISWKDVSGSSMPAVRALTKEEIVRVLNAAREYAQTIPAATGKIGCVGFCWGGSASFLYATAQPDLDAAVVFYGTSPDKDELAQIEAPVLAHYGEMDARVNVTIAPAEAEMKRLSKHFEYSIYTNAGHGFLRAQDGRDGSNMSATEKAWPRTIEFFRKHLEK